MKYMRNFCIVSLAFVLTSFYSIMANTRNTYTNEYYESNCDRACGCFSLEAHGGIYPNFWLGRDGCCNGVELPRFSRLFKFPFIVGGRLGYNWNECIELYAEVDYARAKGKVSTCPFSTPTSVTGSATVTTQLSPYKVISFYIGGHYYLDSDWYSCWCNWKNVAFFIGSKGGFIHHKAMSATISATSPVGNLSPVQVPYFCKTTTVSSGINCGFDYCFCGGLSLVFCVELVASGAIKSNTVIGLPTPIPGINVNTLLVGQFESELAIPVTVGLKYSF